MPLTARCRGRRFTAAGIAIWTGVAIVAGPSASVGSGSAGTEPLANVIVVLDSSGSMREAPDAQDSGDPMGLVDSPDEGELVGDDPSSKLAEAKRVLSEIIAGSPPELRFHLGKYSQSAKPTDFGPEVRDRFLYATTDKRAAQIVIRQGGDGTPPPGLKRSVRDERTADGTTTYYLFATTLWNGERVQVQADGTGVQVAGKAAAANPPFVDVQRQSRSGQPLDKPVRFTFKGVRWNKANRAEDPLNRALVLVNNESCGGFVPLTSDRAEIGRYLGPEIGLKADGTIDGYGVTADGSVSVPKEYGIRASGLTPLANMFVDLRKLFGSTWKDLRQARTFVVLVTDGDDTCADDHTGDLTIAHGDERALRAAYQAQLLHDETGVPVMVVTFGRAVSGTRSDWIAWGGSGMRRPATGEGNAARWTTQPKDADRAPCASCRDAIKAADAVGLEAGIREAIRAGLAGATR